MTTSSRVGIVGDFNAGNITHQFTNQACADLGLAFEWIPTDAIVGEADVRLAESDGIWIAPASPYRSMDGALTAIRYARERGVPLVGTWGGFQHAIVEFARNVLGVQDADHAETNPDAERLVITPLACSLVGQQQPITFVPGSRAAKLYDTGSAVEDFYCNYGVNPAYRNALEAHGLSVSGIGPDGEIRIVELRDHPFFMATLFLPQARSSRAMPHPVLLGYAAALSSKPN